MKTRFVVALMLIAVPVAALAQYRHNTDYYFDRSDALLREQLGNVERHLPPGIQNLRARDYRRAQGEFQFILNYFPNHPQVLALMSEVCSGWKSPKCTMEELFERAIAVNPKASGTYTVMGIHQLKQRRLQDAIESFQQALDLDPNSLNAHYNLGLAYVETRQYALANEHAQTAYALGAPFPGLREKLRKVGSWKPIDQSPTQKAEEVTGGAQQEAERSRASSSGGQQSGTER
jgi:Tfp pilus assembly protein PilF